MKNVVVKWLFSMMILFTAFLIASGQIYVTVRPAVPVVVRTTPPSHEHIWIEEEWSPRGTEYIFTGGHWENPPHQGYVWRKGHWRRHHHKGLVWVPGSWRRE